MAERRPKIAFIDCFDLLIEHERPLTRILHRNGASWERFVSTMGRHALLADTGKMSFNEYQGHFNALFTGNPNFMLIPNLSPIPEMHSLVDSMRESGIICALLTNAAEGAIDIARQEGLLPEMDHEYNVESWRYGFRKPDGRIYQAALGIAHDLGIGPEDAVFMDDRELNVAGAQAEGIRSYHFNILLRDTEPRRIARELGVAYSHQIEPAA